MASIRRSVLFAAAVSVIAVAAHAASPKELELQAACGDPKVPAARRIVACGELADGYAASPANHAAALYLRGTARLESKDTAGAMADYTASLAVKPDFPDPLYARGLVRHDAGDIDGAIADFDAYIAFKPDDAPAFAARAEARVKKGDTARAIADYSRVLELAPDNAEALYGRAIAYKAMGDRPRYEQDAAAYLRVTAKTPPPAPN